MTDDVTDGLVADAVVAWADARAANLANWNERVDIHVREYGLERYAEDSAYQSAVVRADLDAMAPHLTNGLDGMSLCHLQCHIGTDTVSLARAGARVTGVDFSAPALRAAASLATALGVEATWIESDVLDARAGVDRECGPDATFDVVYTSIGAITWFEDLTTWARQIAALLTPGGLFYIRDGHPAMYALDESRDELVIGHRYFADGRAQEWTTPTSYVGSDALENPRTFEFPHSIAEVVTAVLAAGLQVEAFAEGDTLPWKFSDLMIDLGDGEYAYPEPLRSRVPMTFTLVARRPH